MSELIRAAGIDCGTNSIRLLIADVDPVAGRLEQVVRLMEVVRLGQGVDQTGQFAPEALERTLAQVRRFGRLCREHQVGAVRMVATSATRDAANRQVFLDAVRSELGVAAEVIDGIEEAQLGFLGALTGSAGALPRPLTCVDLGGGSTELVLGTSGPEQAYSMNVGCVRLTERHLLADPPTVAELAAAAADVDAALDQAEGVVELGRTRTLVGLAGTVTTVTAEALGLERYDPEVIDGATLPVAEVLAACDRLAQATRAQRAALGFMHPGRVAVIGGGAVVWARVVTRVCRAVAHQGGNLTSVVTSEHDMLDGIALTAAGLRCDQAR